MFITFYNFRPLQYNFFSSSILSLHIAHLEFILTTRRKINQKNTTTFNICRRFCGKNWELQQKMFLWIYTSNIRPMLSYASVVWWPEPPQAGAIPRISSIQRQTCLGGTGAMRSTPTSALEVILNMPPLNIYVQSVQIV